MGARGISVFGGRRAAPIDGVDGRTKPDQPQKNSRLSPAPCESFGRQMRDGRPSRSARQPALRPSSALGPEGLEQLRLVHLGAALDLGCRGQLLELVEALAVELARRGL